MQLHTARPVFEAVKRREILSLTACVRVGDAVDGRGEDDGAARLKAFLVDRQAILAIARVGLDLRPWEQVYYAELDGRRRKRVSLKVMGE